MAPTPVVRAYCPYPEMSPEIGGSLQYAGTHLKTQLFMVLGHEGCGAVQAALAAKFQGVQERSRIQLLLQNILPGFDEVEPQLPPQQKLERAVESNVRWSMRQILETPEGRARMAEGRMKLVGGGVRDRDWASAAACVAPITPQGTFSTANGVAQVRSNPFIRIG